MNQTRIAVVALCLTLMAAAFAPTADGHPTASAVLQDENDTFDQAEALFTKMDYAKAIEAYRIVVEREPENSIAWFHMGYALHVLGELEDALQAHIAASRFPETRKPALYNAACACSLLGRKDDAFRWLGKAVAAGFDNPEMLRSDPDLAGIRDDPRFAPFLPAEPPADEHPFRGDVRVIHTFVGEAAGDQFGWIGRNIGDADGDGAADVLISAPFKNIAGANAGKIYVYSGKTGALLFTKCGSPGDFLGLGIEGAGDVDGDGRADVLAGAPRLGGGPGQALVFSGRDGSTLLVLTASEAGDAFGRKCAGPGDLDGDGHADILVGAPGSDAFAPDAGRAYVYSGKDGALLATLDGEEAGDAFGVGINGIVRGECKLLVVGAGNAGPGDRGLAYVYAWRPSGPELSYVVEADETGANLGRMFVSFVGDVDADGCPDVYVSDWENNARGKNTGRIYVHSGKDGERLLTLTGENAGDGFGIGTAEAGDLDGDGHDDLVIGAWQSSDGAAGAGKVYLYSGKDGVLLDTWVCTAPGDTFGFDTTEVGDLDGDGGTDFLITSAWSSVRGAKSGRAFVIAGPVCRSAESVKETVTR